MQASLSPGLINADQENRGKGQGCKIFNLGGGLGGNDDKLMSFKRSFSHKTKPFYVYCKINNPEAYNEICKEREIDPNIDYFPAYRGNR